LQPAESTESNPIFLNRRRAPEARPEQPTIHKKKGRQRTNEKVKKLFMVWRITRGFWPKDLYYTIHYIKKDGQYHDIFLDWKAEAEALTGKKYRINQAVQPGIPHPRSKILHFPDKRASSKR